MKDKLQHYFQISKNYIIEHKKQFSIGAGIVAGIAVVGIVAAIVMYNHSLRFAYPTVNACDLFTPAEAQSMLGEKIISVDSKNPVVSGNSATSKCSFTDTSSGTDAMIVAAVAVRAAINDTGTAENKEDFAAAKANNVTDIVTGLGESAFFNKTNGQLHVLDGRQWTIISYGVGSDPASNSIDKAVELAHKVIK